MCFLLKTVCLNFFQDQNRFIIHSYSSGTFAENTDCRFNVKCEILVDEKKALILLEEFQEENIVVRLCFSIKKYHFVDTYIFSEKDRFYMQLQKFTERQMVH